MITVRPARPDDAGAIVPIVNHIIDTTSVTFTTARKTPEGIQEEIIARDGAYFVALHAGQIVGFATYFPFRNGPGYARTKEHSIVLAPGAKGQGGGRALIGALCDHARQAGVHSLWAGVSAENPAGVAFHRAMGFVEIATLPEVGFKFGRWMDLVLMQRRL